MVDKDKNDLRDDFYKALDNGDTNEQARIRKEISLAKKGTEQKEKSLDEQISDIKTQLQKEVEWTNDETKANSLLEQLKILMKQKTKEEAGDKETSLKDKIAKFKKQKSLSKNDKEELWRLLDEKEKERSGKQKVSTQKSNDPLMQNLFDKLNDINENRIDNKVEKIDKISTVALPRIPLPTFEKKSEDIDGVKSTTLSLGVHRLTYKARVRHHRLNRVSSHFNKIGDEPKKGLNYITAMCKKSEGWRPMAAMIRETRAWLEDKDIMNNPDVFTKKVQEQKKIFIDDITKWITRPEEQPAIEAIKSRIDYFAQQYYLTFANKLLGAIPTPSK